MNPPKFDRCLEEIRSYLGEREEVETAIAYGSVAMGTAREESDIDLLLVAPSEYHEELAHALYEIGNRYDVTTSPYLVGRGEVARIDRQFIESVVRDGTVLKGDPLDPTLSELGLEPYYLVALHLSHLPQKVKMKIARELYGYRSVNHYKGREYESRRRGFLHREGGMKLGRGTFLIPAHAWAELESLLQAHDGKRWAFGVWVRTPL